MKNTIEKNSKLSLFSESDTKQFVFLKKNQIKEDENDNIYFVDRDGRAYSIGSYGFCELSSGDLDENGEFYSDEKVAESLVEKGFTEIIPMEM